MFIFYAAEGFLLLLISIFNKINPKSAGDGGKKQCSQMVQFSRTLVRNRTFLGEMVRKWLDFALKSLILTKIRRSNAKNCLFSERV